MKVYVNEKNEVINFLWGYGYDDRLCLQNEKEVNGFSFDCDFEKAKYINDKQLCDINRYYIDEAGTVHKKSDETIKAMQEYTDIQEKKQIEELIQNNIKILALKNIDKTSLSESLINKINEKINTIILKKID